MLHYWPQKSKFGKNVKKKNKKKNPGHIILLHTCTINQDHVMYGSWDMKFNRQKFLVILGTFLPFYPRNTLKKTQKISSFYTSVPKIMIIYCTHEEIWHMRDVIVIFISTFLQTVNGRKNSIYNWVKTLNLIIKLPMKSYSSKKNCCCCCYRKMMCRLCLCSQRECRK